MDLAGTVVNALVVGAVGAFLAWLGKGKFEAIDARFQAIEVRLDGMDRRFDRLPGIRRRARAADRAEGGTP